MQASHSALSALSAVCQRCSCGRARRGGAASGDGRVRGAAGAPPATASPPIGDLNAGARRGAPAPSAPISVLSAPCRRVVSAESAARQGHSPGVRSGLATTATARCGIDPIVRLFRRFRAPLRHRPYDPSAGYGRRQDEGCRGEICTCCQGCWWSPCEKTAVGSYGLWRRGARNRRKSRRTGSTPGRSAPIAPMPAARHAGQGSAPGDWRGRGWSRSIGPEATGPARDLVGCSPRLSKDEAPG